MSSSSASSSLILVSDDDEVDELVVVLVLALVVVVVVFWFRLCNTGAAESKPEEEGTDNYQDRYYDREWEGGSNKNESSSSSRGSTTLAVGVAVGTALLIGVAWGESSSGGSTALAVGTALLGVAWCVSRYRSKDPHERVDNHYFHAKSFKTMPVANSNSQGREIDYHLKSAVANHSYSQGQKIHYDPESAVANYSHSQGQKSTLKILSYNVCWREDYAAIQVRMKAIGDLVQLYTPEFLCFQEITPAIFDIFKESSWWSDYYCSMSNEKASKRKYFCILLLSKSPLVIPVSTFTEHIGMGKELCVTRTRIGTNKSLVVATSHLKSRNSSPNDLTSQHHQFKKQRSDQAKEALAILGNYPNVIFGGDMNWDEEMDGEFPLPEGWVDAWTELKGKEVGYTFDTKSNKMLKGHWPTVQMRFDRILCNLKGFKLEKIEIVGKEAIPDQWTNKKLPVLPRDHYGLLLTVCT